MTIVDKTEHFVLWIETNHNGFIPMVSFRQPVGNEGNEGDACQTYEEAVAAGAEMLKESQERVNRLSCLKVA